MHTASHMPRVHNTWYTEHTIKSRPLAALVDKPQAQIMCQKPGKTLIPIDKPQLYFADAVKCINEVCSQR